MFEGSRAFGLLAPLANPGAGTYTPVPCDLFRRGRNTDPGMDVEGTLVTDWVMLAPPTVNILPLGELIHPDTGLIYWVHGVPEKVRSLLTGEIDHIEARLKTVYRVMEVVDIVRDSDITDRNDRGDPVDTGITVPPERSALPASIVERRQVTPTDVDLRTITSWVGWLSASADVRVGDTVRRTDNSRFRVNAITRPIDLGLRELHLDLTRTS